jgi:hypothetical protein
MASRTASLSTGSSSAGSSRDMGLSEELASPASVDDASSAYVAADIRSSSTGSSTGSNRSSSSAEQAAHMLGPHKQPSKNQDHLLGHGKHPGMNEEEAEEGKAWSHWSPKQRRVLAFVVLVGLPGLW